MWHDRSRSLVAQRKELEAEKKKESEDNMGVFVNLILRIIQTNTCNRFISGSCSLLIKRHKFSIIFLFILALGQFLFATTWNLKKVPCPHSQENTCLLVEISSWGSYIYRYYPDRLNYVFWPATMKEWVVTCHGCKWAVLRDDFDKLNKASFSDIEKLPLTSNLGDKVLNTLHVIGGNTADSAFVLRWILQQGVPVTMPVDSIYCLELSLLSELYSGAKTLVDSCLFQYLVGRYTLLKGDTASSESYFRNIIKKDSCREDIRWAASINLLTCQTGLDFRSKAFRDKVGCFLYDSIGIKNEESSILRMRTLVTEYNKTPSVNIEQKILNIAEKYRKEYTSTVISEMLDSIRDKTSRLQEMSIQCKRNAEEIDPIRSSNQGKVYSLLIVVGLLSILILMIASNCSAP